MDKKIFSTNKQSFAANQKKTVLVAEDDPYYSNIFKTKLTKEGFEVHLAENGKQALKMLETVTPQLILMDLIMPEMDGFQTLEKIKADEKLKDINVIVLSNLGQENDIIRARELGSSDYMIKSNVGIDEVVAKVKSYFP